MVRIKTSEFCQEIENVTVRQAVLEYPGSSRNSKLVRTAERVGEMFVTVQARPRVEMFA